MTVGWGRRPRRWTAGALVLAAGIGVASCTSARNTLGPPVGACYRALPVAAAAVHHQGRFAGVRLVSRHELAPEQPIGRLLATAGAATPRSACVVAFRGRFTAADVTDATPGSATTGRWATVVVTMPADQVVATVVEPRPPSSFTDLF